ncbi:phenylacetate--CoA ligase family protein [Parachitinimonas caeni]|uniref:Phenylacetate-CoA ligase n=1 Tax=Parachitinimonas caeni TaxID=3031301 RepID=A0ABT7DYM8_9NEIS|nr:hypothetical protein [Parachitinimonas caeni]MDK2125165.1 hypothetical protein [Parachitinimonas caeni]
MLKLEHLVAFARHHSPYYAQLYRDVPTTGWQINDLPLVDPVQYWANNGGLHDWPALTGPIADAHVFKTGGTTGSGKMSVYTREEWRTFVRTFGRGMSRQLNTGDRIANLFFAGDLYASFLFIHGSLAHMDTPVCEYPFTGAADPKTLTEQILSHHINVLVGVPAQLLRYAADLASQDIQLPCVTALLYGGESLFAEQLDLLHRVLPNARIASIGCASVDAGLIGAATPDCQLGEHRCFEPETIVEIIDEASGEVIRETGRSGMLVITNLTRALMPLIRYPVGDLAAWVEPEGSSERKFVLLGRSSLGHRLRVGAASLFPDELSELIQQLVGKCHWQLVIDHRDGKDQVCLRIAHEGTAAQAQQLIDTLEAKDPGLAQQMADGQTVLAVEWCSQAALVLQARTGKLQRVIDRRDYRAQPGGAA